MSEWTIDWGKWVLVSAGGVGGCCRTLLCLDQGDGRVKFLVLGYQNLYLYVLAVWVGNGLMVGVGVKDDLRIPGSGVVVIMS